MAILADLIFVWVTLPFRRMHVGSHADPEASPYLAAVLTTRSHVTVYGYFVVASLAYVANTYRSVFNKFVARCSACASKGSRVTRDGRGNK